MPLDHRFVWDTRYLKTKLARKQLSETGVFFYFLAITGFDYFQVTAIRLWPPIGPLTSWDFADTIFTLALTFLGLLFTFYCNGGGRGRDFLYRYFPLSFAVGWKFVASAIVGQSLVSVLLKDAPLHIVGWISTIVFWLVYTGMFLRIGHHMRELAHAGVGKATSLKKQLPHNTARHVRTGRS